MKYTIRKTSIISLIILATASLLLMVGCATNKPTLALDPVGPPPGLPSASQSQGSLVVFSAFDQHGISGMDRQVHSNYEILSENGNPLKKVYNDPQNMMGGPIEVGLPVGCYRVVARANGYGLVTVPVVIEGGKETTLHLEGGGSWPNRAKMIEAGAVRLPDGRVVGWRATTQNTKQP